MEEFKLYLDKYRKKNGDMLLESTKERYIEWIKRFRNEFDDRSKILEIMNSKVKTGNIVMHAAFRAYLTFLGFEKEKILSLEKPPVMPTSWSSVRMLQNKVLARAELRILMEGTKDLKMKLIMSMLYDTAARRDELMKIRYKHIEAVKEPKDNIYAKITVMGKGHKSRQVYLQKQTFELLKEYSKNKRKMDYVIRFIQDNGTEYKNQTHQLWKELSKYAEPLLGRNIHPHMFRHSQAQHIADNGGTLSDVMYILGHSKADTAMIYIHNSTFMGERAFKNYAKTII